MKPTQPWCWPRPGWMMERGPSDACPWYSTWYSRAGGHAMALSPVWASLQHLHPCLQQHVAPLPPHSTFEPQWLNTSGRKEAWLPHGGGLWVEAKLCCAMMPFLIKAHPCIWPQPIPMISFMSSLSLITLLSPLLCPRYSLHLSQWDILPLFVIWVSWRDRSCSFIHINCAKISLKPYDFKGYFH